MIFPDFDGGDLSFLERSCTLASIKNLYEFRIYISYIIPFADLSKHQVQIRKKESFLGPNYSIPKKQNESAQIWPHTIYGITIFMLIIGGLFSEYQRG